MYIAEAVEGLMHRMRAQNTKYDNPGVLQIFRLGLRHCATERLHNNQTAVLGSVRSQAVKSELIVKDIPITTSHMRTFHILV